MVLSESAGARESWQGDSSIEGSFVVDHADTLNGSSLSLSSKVPPTLPVQGDENPRVPTRREEEIEDEEREHSDDLVPKIIGLAGEAWPAGRKQSVRDPAERLRSIVCQLIEKSERARVMFMWRLNATRSKASALAVWAVDQGNRKAYEVERALMAENSWATRSVIWEGYRHSPLVGVTDSGWFWSSTDAYGSSKTWGQLAGELRLAQQRCGYLAAQLEAARQQLMDWQEVAEFESVDGTWHSLRMRDLQRQLKAARLHQRLRAHTHSPAQESQREDSASSDAQSAGGAEAEREREEQREGRRLNLRSWMMGYESEREIRSTIPGLSTTPRTNKEKGAKGKGKGGREGDSASEGSHGEFGDERMRELLTGVPSGPLRPATAGAGPDGKGAGAAGSSGTGGSSSPGAEAAEEVRRERERREAAERKYEELRGMAVHLEETLVETVAELEMSSQEELRLRQQVVELRSALAHAPSPPSPAEPSPADPSLANAPPCEEMAARPTSHKPLPPTHRNQACQAGGGAGEDLIWCPEAAAESAPLSHQAPPAPALPQASPDTPPRPEAPPPPAASGSASPLARQAAAAAGLEAEAAATAEEEAARDEGKSAEELRAELQAVREQLRQRTAQLQEAVAIGVGIEWVM